MNDAKQERQQMQDDVGAINRELEVSASNKPAVRLLVKVDSDGVLVSRMFGAVELTGIDKASGELKYDYNLNCWLDVLYDGLGTALAIDAIRNAIAGRMGLRALWICPRCRVEELVANACRLCGYKRDICA